MKTTNRIPGISARVLIATALASSGFFALAAPSFAQAATYAFVNAAQEVSVVQADSWTQAIANAVNIDAHSGVLLLTAQNTNIVGSHI